jgi:hypothetical protein
MERNFLWLCGFRVQITPMMQITPSVPLPSYLHKMGVASIGSPTTRYTFSTHFLHTMDRINPKLFSWKKLRPAFLQCFFASALVGLTATISNASPYGTWLSKPQIMFHLSNGTLDPAMQRMRAQQYRVVFLDFRNVSDLDQQKVARAARQSQLMPVAWIQSPQFRSLSVRQLIDEGKHTDGIQVDDHYFANYSPSDFYALRSQYTKQIFCSIQPFQAAQVPRTGCNQLDVQCYSPVKFKQCVGLADRLRAVPSLSTQNTLGYREQMGGRSFNVFLWPHSDEFVVRGPAQNVKVTSGSTGL